MALPLVPVVDTANIGAFIAFFSIMAISASIAGFFLYCSLCHKRRIEKENENHGLGPNADEESIRLSRMSERMNRRESMGVRAGSVRGSLRGSGVFEGKVVSDVYVP